jgi:MOSC domain-containing protein YiiM
MNTLSLTDDLQALAPAPKEVGRVVRVVLRPKRGTRTRVQSAMLTVEGGMDGDRWGLRAHRSKARQLSAIRADVIDALAGEADPILSGDNLHVLLDLSTSNLPPGTRMQIGAAAVVEVSAETHAPCALFSGRFGQDAHDITLSPAFEDQRLRGVLLSVVAEGRVAEGDKVRILRGTP